MRASNSRSESRRLGTGVPPTPHGAVTQESRPRGRRGGVLFVLALAFGWVGGISAVMALEGANLGSDPFPGVWVPASGGGDVQAAGRGLGGVADEAFLVSELRTGDFDMRVRVVALGPGDLWAQAGMMARESVAPEAPCAAVFATPSNVGAGFLARPLSGSPAEPVGLFPVNYPHTWLRLRREGNLFSGYAALDGVHWARLGSMEVAMPPTVQLGLVVASHRTGEPVHASFRDWTPVTGAGELRSPPPREVPGQASRLTPFTITEIMYHPAGPEAATLEFVEIFNPFGTAEDLSGYRLTGDIDYTFPAGTVLAGGAYGVIARDPAALAAHYGLADVLGPFTGALSDNGGTIRLRHRTGAVFLEVNFGTQPPWPRSADGTGHSLVLARPTYGQSEPAAWSASDEVGGSPGRADSVGPEPLRGLCINEWLAHTDDPLLDYVELYNSSRSVLDLSGGLISDHRSALTSAASTNVFRIPDGTQLHPGEHVAWDQAELGFALDAAGETIYLMNPGRTRILDAVRFAGQANGVSSGRCPDGAADISPLAIRTPGQPNGSPLPPTVVINELLYAPISGRTEDEFVELHNPGSTPIDVSGWRFTDGIDFTLPPATSLPAGGYLVVAASRTNLLARYPGTLHPGNTVGDYRGSLDNGGERVALSRPEELITTNALQQITTNIAWILVHEVPYRDGGRWSRWADGGGSSLELVDPRGDGRRPSNWEASDETDKAPWTTVDYTDRVELGETRPDQLQVLPLGAGEYLLDDVQVLDAHGVELIANGAFTTDAAGWTAQGTLSQSGHDPTGGLNGGGGYRVLGVDRGDNQINRVRTRLATATGGLIDGSLGTIRAKVRWLRGHPEMILRVRGRWLETLVPLAVPTNPGTPGQPNSRRRPNAGPAVFDVTHFPVVPAALEPVRVTARAQDPDGVQAVRLIYRLEPGAGVTTAVMTDDGLGADETAGDGIYSAGVPGQAAGVQVAFRVEADDGARAVATTLFPAEAPVRECLVRWGDWVKPGSIPAYRLWMTEATFDAWSARHKLDNTANDVTFVQGNQRAIYNACAQFAGSPYIAPGFTTPSGARCGYSIEVPADDPFLGGTDLVLDWPGGHGNETTAVQEQMAYWVADRMGLPFSLRHYIRLSVNGVTDMRRGGVFEAVIQPARDFIRAWSPGDPDGDFYKLDRAFEFSDAGDLIAEPMPTLQVFNGADGRKRPASYRWNWLRRSYDSADSFTELFAWVDAVNAPGPEPYTSQVSALMDIEECMGIFAFEHIIVNFDSWGHDIGKNMYAYKPLNGRWQLYAFDLDWLMLVAAGWYGPANAPLFNSQDPTVRRLYLHPPFRRAYFRAVQAAVNGPFRPENCNPVMQAKYRWLVDEGVSRCDGSRLSQPTGVEQWFATRRSFLVSQLAAVEAAFGVDGPTERISGESSVRFTGTAPVEVATLQINGVTRPPTWTTANTWSAVMPLAAPGTNTLEFVGLDPQGRPVPGAVALVRVEYVGPPPPAWSYHVRFNEWMADNQTTLIDPADAQAEDWFELYNPGPSPADLSGFHLTDDLGLWSKWIIPTNTVIPAGGYLLVWADNEPDQNGLATAELHAGFQLSKNGDALGLFAPDGTRVDSVTFGPQAEDVSQGRHPDAGPKVAFLTAATPAGPNAAPYRVDTSGPALEPAVFRRTGDEVTLGWQAVPGATYQLESTGDLGQPEWTPLGPAQPATTPVLQVRLLIAPANQQFFRLVQLP